MIVSTRPGVGPFTAGDVPSERSQQPSWSWSSGHKEPDPNRPRWPRRQQQTPLHRPPNATPRSAQAQGSTAPTSSTPRPGDEPHSVTNTADPDHLTGAVPHRRSSRDPIPSGLVLAAGGRTNEQQPHQHRSVDHARRPSRRSHPLRHVAAIPDLDLRPRHRHTDRRATQRTGPDPASTVDPTGLHQHIRRHRQPAERSNRHAESSAARTAGGSSTRRCRPDESHRCGHHARYRRPGPGRGDHPRLQRTTISTAHGEQHQCDTRLGVHSHCTDHGVSSRVSGHPRNAGGRAAASR